MKTRLPFATVACAALLASGALGPAPAHAATKVPVFTSCAKMNAQYPHGVGRKGAKDKVRSGAPVRNFRVDNKIYAANASRLDRDHDGIACEKH